MTANLVLMLVLALAVGFYLGITFMALFVMRRDKER